jgi:hypothetical protein
LGLSFKFQPLKAKAKPSALFFDGVCVDAPKEGTKRWTAKDTGVSLAWNHSKTLCRELGPWRLLPW